MKIRKTLASATILGTLISISAHSIAADGLSVKTEEPKLDGLKIAIIKNAVGSNEIIAGNYQLGLSKLTNSSDSALIGYETAMGLCAANIKLNELITADKACTEAIEAISALKGRGRHREFLKAIAYSNRAVVRYLDKDKGAALEDLTSALLINDSSIIKNNIIALRDNTETSTDEIYSD